jgi:hypothetical protein
METINSSEISVNFPCTDWRFNPEDNALHVRFEGFTAVTMKNVVFETLRRMALVRTDVSDELSASIIRMTRIGELGT